MPAHAAALGATWLVRMVRGECVAAKNAGVRLVTLAEDVNNDVLLINGHMNTQIACHHLGLFSEAREYAVKVMALADHVSHAERCINALDPVVASLAESARNCWIMGYLQRALADCERAVTIGEALRHPDSLAFAWLFHAWIHGYRGDWTTCLASVDTGIRIASGAGSVQTLAWNQCVRGWARAHVGDVETGRSELSRGSASRSRQLWRAGHLRGGFAIFGPPDTAFNLCSSGCRPRISRSSESPTGFALEGTTFEQKRCGAVIAQACATFSTCTSRLCQRGGCMTRPARIPGWPQRAWSHSQ